MKKIINKNNSRLVFPKYDFVIDTGEIKEVSDEQFDGLIRNASIEEVLHKSLETVEINTEKKEIKRINKKGRRK